jgi:ABC-2 type transport system permease protein
LKFTKYINRFKNPALAQFAIVAGILLLLNIIGSSVHGKLDLTEEKRFTLTKATKSVLKNLKENVTVKIFLGGKNLPGSFQKLQSSTAEMLKSFKEVSGNKVQFAFENPIADKTVKDQEEIKKAYTARGMEPINLKVQQEANDGLNEQIIFPYALINANGKEYPVDLLENNLNQTPAEKLNKSEMLLEYKLITGIKNVFEVAPPEIAYIVGNGELLGPGTLDALYSLAAKYEMDTVDLRVSDISPTYKVAIIAKPTVPFDEASKFKIDQFVMSGGRILWYLDATDVSMDTLQKTPNYMAMPSNLNLDDLLFKYGVRVNNNLIEDMTCNPIPVKVGSTENEDMVLLDWVYFPVITPTAKHPIVKNLEPLMATFTSSIDTIANKTNHKTILLNSSAYSRIINTPASVSLNNLRYKPKLELFTKKYLPIGVLIEGNFNSIFENRMDPAFIKSYDSVNRKFRVKTEKESKMIVVSDGDMFKNDFSEKRGPMPLGFYKFNNQMYANRDFLLNAVEYLTDDSGILDARGREIKLRLLDAKKVKKYRLQWQLINILLPIGIIVLSGIVLLFFRKRKFEQKFVVKNNTQLD